jgi:hypothetical protein
MTGVAVSVTEENVPRALAAPVRKIIHVCEPEKGQSRSLQIRGLMNVTRGAVRPGLPAPLRGVSSIKIARIGARASDFSAGSLHRAQRSWMLSNYLRRRTPCACPVTAMEAGRSSAGFMRESLVLESEVRLTLIRLNLMNVTPSEQMRSYPFIASSDVENRLRGEERR